LGCADQLKWSFELKKYNSTFVVLNKLFTYLLSIHFLLAGLLPEQNLQELNKIPVLVQHYFHHTQEENQSLSFAEFLLMHYGNSEHRNQENHEDLPLFTHHCGCQFFVHQEVYFNEPQGVLIASAIQPYQPKSYDVLHDKGIFQPPRA
jgi:hypothetical protein